MTVRLYRWNTDTRGTTATPEHGALAILRCDRGLRLRWSVCRVVVNAAGHRTLENVADYRTMRECREYIELQS